MATKYINSITYGGNEYKLVDNSSGYITDAGVTSFNGNTGAVIYTAPVTSVNGSTGAVVIPELFIVTGTITSTSGSGSTTTYSGTADKSINDIIDAVNAGKYPIFKMSLTVGLFTDTIVAPLAELSDTNSGSVPSRALFIYDQKDTSIFPVKYMEISMISSNFTTTAYDASGTLKLTLIDDNGTYRIDHLYSDVATAVQNGDFVYLYDSISTFLPPGDSGGYNIAVLSNYSVEEAAEDEIYFYFTCMRSTIPTATPIIYQLYDDGTDGGAVYITSGSVSLASNALTANNATSATNATNATNSTNIANEQFTSSTYSTYYVPFMPGYTAANRQLYAHNGAALYTRVGTASAVGGAYLKLGNTTSSGTAGNMRGGIDLYAQSGGYYTRLQTTNTMTANNTLTLPTATGTVALTSDVPSILTGTTAPTSSQGSDGDIYIRY